MMCPDDEIADLCLIIVQRNEEYDYVNSIALKSFELYSKKNTKATGILKALEYLNVDIENSYAFGDGKNDIEMLSTVGCGIAMGNADDEVKKYANKVTETVHNDGVAVGIKKFIFNHKYTYIFTINILYFFVPYIFIKIINFNIYWFRIFY